MNVEYNPAAEAADTPARPPTATRNERRDAGMSLVVVVYIVAASLAVSVLAMPALRHWQEQPAPPAEPVRSAWAEPSDLAIGAGTDFPFGLALAPDGRRVVFPAARAGAVSLWLQDTRTGETRLLPDTSNAALPFWSPDGTRVGFFADGKVRALDLTSSIVSDLAAAPTGRGAAWSANGALVFAADATSGLTVTDASGATRALTEIDTNAGESSHRMPVVTADGKWVVFFVRASQPSRQGIWVASLDNPAIGRRRLVGSEGHGVVASDRLIYASGDAVVAQQLDAATATLASPTTLLGMPVGVGPNNQLFATAARDALVFGPPGTALRDLVWMTRAGERRATLGDAADTWDVRIAPDGRRVAVTQVDAQLRALDIWIYDGRQRLPMRLSPSTDADESPVWSPDGHRVAWASGRQAVTVRGAGAVMPEETLLRVDPFVRVTSWSPDGRTLIVSRSNPQTREDLWAIDTAGRADPVPVVTSPFNDIQGAISPDGRWLAYASDESGRYDVYVDSFPKLTTRVRVTTGGGLEPRWRRDGHELFFRRGTEVHAAVFEQSGSDLRVANVTRLFDAGGDIRSFDVSADGQLLLNLPAAASRPAPPTVVVNWLSLANSP